MRLVRGVGALLAALVWIAVLVGNVRAQEGPELPPVLRDADVFFTENVEIVERLPAFEWDNDQRVVYYFDPMAETWAAIPYPDELTEIWGVVARSDGTYVVGPDVTNGIQWELRQDVKWVFDPVQGGFVQPAFTCRRVADLPGEGEWRVIYDPEPDAHFLCHTVTDERLGPLPEAAALDLDRYAGPYSLPAWTSPDGVWVVFFNGAQFTPQFYAAEVATGELRFLGLGPDIVDRVDVERWADATHPVIRTLEIAQHFIPITYIADVTQSESLHVIAPFGPWLPQYHDDPPRYEWIVGEHRLYAPAPGEPSPEYAAVRCQPHVFDLQTLEMTTYPRVEGVCKLGRLVPDGSGDHVVIVYEYEDDSAFPTLGRLVRYNPRTGLHQELIAGNLAWLHGVTPDGRYALLTLGANIPFESTYVPEVGIIEGDVEAPELAIFDLVQGEIAWRMEGLWAYHYDFLFSGLEIEWLAPGMFLLTETGLPDRLLNLTAETLGELQLPNAAFGDPDGTRIPIWTDTPTFTWGVTIYDAATEVQTPVVRSLAWDPYIVYTEWVGEDLLRVEVVSKEWTRWGAPRLNEFTVGAWIVRVP